MTGLIHDITDKKKALDDLKETEENLRQSQKLESIGRLGGGVAHDFNNLLTAILGYSDILLTDHGPQGRLSDEIREIKKAAERAASLTSQLLAFSRKQMLFPRQINLNDLIINLRKMLRRVIDERIECVETSHIIFQRTSPFFLFESYSMLRTCFTLYVPGPFKLAFN